MFGKHSCKHICSFLCLCIHRKVCSSCFALQLANQRGGNNGNVRLRGRRAAAGGRETGAGGAGAGRLGRGPPFAAGGAAILGQPCKVGIATHPAGKGTELSDGKLCVHACMSTRVCVHVCVSTRVGGAELR